MAATNRRVNLIDEGIDVAIRVREKFETDADLQVTMIGHSGAILVASPALLDEHSRPAAPADLVSLPTLSSSSAA